ncbi:hypothetical protein WZ342_2362 [Enterococcus faecalis]|nr:hypothetical protein WZ342_2362 [Enterococcus faecalis]
MIKPKAILSNAFSTLCKFSLMLNQPPFSKKDWKLSISNKSFSNIAAPF